MKYTPELLESGILNNFRKSAAFYEITDYLAKTYSDYIFDIDQRKCFIDVKQSDGHSIGFIVHKEDTFCFVGKSRSKGDYKPTSNSFYACENQYD